MINSPETYIDISGAKYPYGTEYKVEEGECLYEIAYRFNTTVEELKRLNKLKTNEIDVNQILVVDEIYNPNKDNLYARYTVKEKDTIYSISYNYGMTAYELMEINNLLDDTIYIGKNLFVFNNEPKLGGKITYKVQKDDNLYQIANKYNTTVENLKNINFLDNDQLSVGMELIVTTEEMLKTEKEIMEPYMVLPKDTLYSIAKNKNTSVKELMEINHLTNDKLHIGQKILIPKE